MSEQKVFYGEWQWVSDLERCRFMWAFVTDEPEPTPDTRGQMALIEVKEK